MKIMNINISAFWMLTISLLMLASCAEDNVTETNERTIILPQSQELVTATLYGLIIDESENMVEGAEVTLHSGVTPMEVVTDEFGNFTMYEVDIKGGAAYISVRYPGKFEAFRKYSVLPDRYNYTEIKLVDQETIGSISATDGGRLSQADGSAISLPAGGIVDDKGQLYQGDVNVAMTWIDPSADDLAQRMIGDLSGIDESGGFRSLASLGMLQVELTDDRGDALNIAEGELAQLTFPIPPSMRDKATSSVPLWSYNEPLGTWVQEGVAVRDGDNYVGDVGHFSAWNVDIFTDPIEITGRVVFNNEEGSNVGGSFLQVYVCLDEIGRKGGWLSSDGKFRFYNFPKDESFKLKVLDKCGDQLFIESYGPFSDNTNLGDIVVETSENVVKVFGNALDCNGEALTDAIVVSFQNNIRKEYPVDDQGRFEFALDFCDAGSIFIEIVNLSDLLFKRIEVPGDKDVVELKDVKVCDDLVDFISITPEGEEAIVYGPFIFSLVVGGLDDASYKVVFEYEDQEGSTDSLIADIVRDVRLAFNIDPMTLEIIGEIDLRFSDSSKLCSSEFGGDLLDITLSVTSFGPDPGDIIEGTFTAKNMKCLIWETQDDVINLEGAFQIPLR